MNVNLLKGSIWKSLIIFAIPLLLSRIFQQLYNTVDAMIVGNYLGEVSLAALGSCTAIYDLMVGFTLGIGNGLAIVAARSYGSQNRDLLKKSVAGSLVIGLVCSLAVSAFGFLMLRPLLRILHTPEEIIEEAHQYISVIMVFVIVMFAYNLCSGLMRAIGNSVVPLIFLAFSSVLNIVLDFLFITRFQMGVRGAAWATVISQGLSVILCLIYMLRKTRELIPEYHHFHIEIVLYKELMGQGFSMGFMSCLVSLGSVILQSGINGLGYLIIAAHTTARKVYMIFNMFFASMAMAISTFVSQNRGADQRERICRAMKIAYIYNVIMAAAISVFLWLFAGKLVHFISGSDDVVVLENGTRFLLVVGPFYAILGVLSETRFALQGLGEKILPIFSSVIELIGKILFAAFLIPRFGYTAVIFCEPVIWCAMALQLVIAFWTHPYIRIKQKS